MMKEWKPHDQNRRPNIESSLQVDDGRDDDDDDSDDDGDDLKPLVNTTFFRPQEQASLTWHPNNNVIDGSKRCYWCRQFYRRHLRLTSTTLFRFSFCVNILLFITIIHNRNNIQMISNTTKPTTTSSSKIHSDNQSPSHGPFTIFGHVQINETGGTEINKQLASRYERVCGSFLYSYDAAAAYNNDHNDQFDNYHTTNIPIKNQDDNHTDSTTSKNSNKRGNISTQTMMEIGFEDCDLISHNDDWEFFWNNIAFAKHHTHHGNNYGSQILNKQQASYRPQVEIELHVPCRDPLDHVLDLCRGRQNTSTNITWYCQKYNNNYDINADADADANQDSKKWEEELIQQLCGGSPIFTTTSDQQQQHKFPMQFLLSEPNNIDQIKCFAPFPIKHYIEYMSNKLQQRKIEVDFETNNNILHHNQHHKKGDKNKKHNNDKNNDDDDDDDGECLFWPNNTKLANRLRHYLVATYEYFEFCDECMGSENELELDY